MLVWMILGRMCIIVIIHAGIVNGQRHHAKEENSATYDNLSSHRATSTYVWCTALVMRPMPDSLSCGTSHSHFERCSLSPGALPEGEYAAPAMPVCEHVPSETPPRRFLGWLACDLLCHGNTAHPYRVVLCTNP